MLCTGGKCFRKGKGKIRAASSGISVFKIAVCVCDRLKGFPVPVGEDQGAIPESVSAFFVGSISEDHQVGLIAVEIEPGTVQLSAANGAAAACIYDLERDLQFPVRRQRC